MRRFLALFVLVSWAGVIGVAAAQRQTPYYASISSGRAMMRTGPGQNYPGTWLYVRPDLPIKVVTVRGDWRRVEDPDGTVGWMLVRLLSDQRTAIVRGQERQPMREAANVESRVLFLAEPGVVGRISACGDGWCRMDVGGRRGHIRVEALWGVDASERIN